MIRPPIKQTIVHKGRRLFYERDIRIASVTRKGAHWIVRPDVDGYMDTSCDTIEEAVQIVNSLADRRAMIRLRENIEHWLKKRGLKHLEVYRTLCMHKQQYYALFAEEVVRGPTLKTLRNIASVLDCTVSDLTDNI